jgi:hypothetical protein
MDGGAELVTSAPPKRLTRANANLFDLRISAVFRSLRSVKVVSLRKRWENLIFRRDFVGRFNNQGLYRAPSCFQFEAKLILKVDED